VQVNAANYTQSFIVSFQSGVNPSSWAPVQVQYGGPTGNNSSINIVIKVSPPSVTTNGLKKYPGTD
jgi:hypothetical protein